jgi:hypothetical protein
MADANAPDPDVPPGTGSPAARRIATRILRWYPKPWRARYGAEMRALVAEMPVAWRQVADLAIGAAREWVSPRAFGWPARSAAGRIQVARGFKFALVIVAFEMVIHATVTPGTISGIWGESLRSACLAVVLATIVRMVLGFLVWRRAWPRVVRPRWFGHVRSAEIACWFLAIAIWIVGDHNQPVPAYVSMPGLYGFAHHFQTVVWIHLLFQFSARTKRLQRAQMSHTKRLLQSRHGGWPTV